MGKLTLTCACGQEMLVPDSAMGKVGLCPQCGREIAISAANTRPLKPEPAAETRRPGSGLLGKRHVVKRVNELREESARKFAAAVDLYNNHRYAEALAVLDLLRTEFPDDHHVQSAREECLHALHGLPALPRTYDKQPIAENSLNADLVRSVVLEKLVHGDDAIQLQAAELAARLLGMLNNGGAAAAPRQVTPSAETLQTADAAGDILAGAVRAAVSDALHEVFSPGAKEAPGKAVRRKPSGSPAVGSASPPLRKHSPQSYRDDEIA